MSGVAVIIDTASPLLNRLQTAAKGAGLAVVAGHAVANLTKEHLIALDAERHRFGRHYYLQAAKSVHSRATGESTVAVSIAQTGFRQRLRGGTILPKKKYLTLPANPEAAGKRAGEFNDLDFGMAMDDNGSIRPALVRRASSAVSFTRRKRKDGSVKYTVKPTELRGGEVMFWLVRKVSQRADPTVLPAGPLLQATADNAIVRRIDRLTNGGTAS